MIPQSSLPIRGLDMISSRIALETQDLVRVDGGGLFDTGEVMFVVVIFGARLGRRFRGFFARARHCDVQLYNSFS